MLPTFETLFAGLVGLCSAIFGSRYLAETVTDAGDLPRWMEWLIGPLGALVGMIVAIKWLSLRLNKAEEREEARRLERDALMKSVIELGIQTKDVIADNSRTIERVNASLANCQVLQAKLKP